MERIDDNRPAGLDKRVLFAVILIIIGGVILASNFNIIPYNIKHYIFSWKMLLIVIGVISLASRQSVVTGVILIGVGTFFMLPDIFVLSFNYHRLFWPVFLIALGIILLFRRRDSHGHINIKSGQYSSDNIDELNIFGGGERTISSDNFKGGKFTAVFGGSTIDFLDAKLAPGTNVIDVFMVSVEIFNA